MKAKLHPFRITPSDFFDVLAEATRAREDYVKIAGEAVDMLEGNPDIRAILRDGRQHNRRERMRDRESAEAQADYNAS